MVPESPRGTSRCCPALKEGDEVPSWCSHHYIATASEKECSPFGAAFSETPPEFRPDLVCIVEDLLDAVLKPKPVASARWIEAELLGFLPQLLPERLSAGVQRFRQCP